MRVALFAIALLGSAISVTLPVAPAAAQSGSVIKDVFGDEPCPTSNGEEIVVCRRLPAQEKYRIPKDLREAAKDAPPPNWMDRVQSLETVGRSGTSSCTADGGGGWTGCWSKIMREARAERKADKAAEPTLP